MLRITTLLFTVFFCGVAQAQPGTKKVSQKNADTYLYNHKRLGLRAIDALLTEIELLTRQGKSAEKQIKLWKEKCQLADSLKAELEKDIGKLQTDLDQERTDKAALSARVIDLETKLAESDSAFQALSGRFSSATLQNARTLDSLNHVIDNRDKRIRKMAKDNYKSGFAVKLYGETRKGKKVLLNPAQPKSGDIDDVKFIEITYDFYLPKELGFPRSGVMEARIPVFKHIEEIKITAIDRGQDWQYKGVIKIIAGEKGLNLTSLGRKEIQVKLFEGASQLQAIRDIFLTK